MCSVEQDGRLSTLYPERFTWYARGGSVVQTYSKINFIRYSKPRRWSVCLMCLCFILYLSIAFSFHSFVQDLLVGMYFRVVFNDVLKNNFFRFEIDRQHHTTPWYNGICSNFHSSSYLGKKCIVRPS